MDKTRAAVHRLRRSHDASSQSFSDHLMSQANAEHRHLGGKLTNDIEGTAGLARRARAGRKDDSLWLQGANPGHADGIVADDQRFLAQPLEIASQVVNEAVEVVEDENQGWGMGNGEWGMTTLL